MTKSTTKSMTVGMKKTLFLLTVLLLVQTALAGYFWNHSRTQDTFAAEEPLLSFSADHITAITITGPDKKTVNLQKKDSRWIIPEYFKAPADGDRVDELLAKLAGLKKSWPVATTPEAAKRFKVTADQFERHIILKKEDTPVAELYVGTSPSFRKVHVRLPSRPEIMAVTFSTQDADDTPDNWLDKDIATLAEDEIAAITLNDIHLLHKDGKWELADHASAGQTGQAANGQTDTAKRQPNRKIGKEKINSIVHALTGLRVDSVLGTRELPAYGLEKPVITCRVDLRNNKTIDYRFGALEDKAYYALKRSDLPYIFKTGKWQVKPLLDRQQKELLTTGTTKKAVRTGPDSRPEQQRESPPGQTASRARQQAP